MENDHEPFHQSSVYGPFEQCLVLRVIDPGKKYVILLICSKSADKNSSSFTHKTP